MKLKELPVGNQIVFGSYAANGTQEPKDLVWTKVTDDGKFILKPGQVSPNIFDAPELRGVNRDRMAHGYNYFPLANIFQFINSPEANWFHPMHDSDRAGYNIGYWGLLASFSSEELTQLLPQEIVIGVPEGSRKKYGRRGKLKCFVTLPSASQYQEDIDEYLKCEGEVIPLLKDPNIFRGWTRSGATNSCHVYVANYGWLDTRNCNSSCQICPMIVINPENEVSLDQTSGQYYVRVKSKEAKEIMTDDFLKMCFK